MDGEVGEGAGARLRATEVLPGGGGGREGKVVCSGGFSLFFFFFLFSLFSCVCGGGIVLVGGVVKYWLRVEFPAVFKASDE